MLLSGPDLELRDVIVEYIHCFPQLNPAMREVRFIYDKNLQEKIKFNGKIVRVGESLLSRDYKEIFGVITHELMHFLFNHADKFKNLQFNPSSIIAANLAMDAIANEGVKLIQKTQNGNVFIVMHEGAVTLKDIYPPSILKKINTASITSELTYEFIMNNLSLADMEELINRDLLGSDLELPLDNPLEEMRQKEGLIETIREEVINNLRQSDKSIGSVIGNRIRELYGITVENKIDFKTKLKEFMIHHLSHKTLSSYDRLSRRSIVYMGINQHRCPIIPGVIPEKGIRLAAITIDTSGSISPDELERFLYTIAEIQEQTECNVHILCADVTVHDEYQIDSSEDIKQLIDNKLLIIRGGGGTDFENAQKRMVELNPDVGIYLTDGYGRYMDKEEFLLNNKFAWVLTQRNNWINNNQLTSNAPPYGNFIELKA